MQQQQDMYYMREKYAEVYVCSGFEDFDLKPWHGAIVDMVVYVR